LSPPPIFTIIKIVISFPGVVRVIWGAARDDLRLEERS